MPVGAFRRRSPVDLAGGYRPADRFRSARRKPCERWTAAPVRGGAANHFRRPQQTAHARDATPGRRRRGHLPTSAGGDGPEPLLRPGRASGQSELRKVWPSRSAKIAALIWTGSWRSSFQLSLRQLETNQSASLRNSFALVRRAKRAPREEPGARSQLDSSTVVARADDLHPL